MDCLVHSQVEWKGCYQKKLAKEGILIKKEEEETIRNFHSIAQASIQ